MPSRLFAGWLVAGIAMACTPTQRAPEASEREAAPSGPESTAPKIDRDALFGHTFMSVSVEGYTLLPDTRVRLQFADDGLHASAGCNQLRIPVGISTGVLTIDELRSTLMNCGEARNEQDAWLRAFVASKPAWSIEGRRLTLRNDEVVVVLKEERPEARADRRLAGSDRHPSHGTRIIDPP